MNNTQFWTLNGMLCLAFFNFMNHWETRHRVRRPASEEPVSLTIKDLQLPSGSKVSELKNVTLRASFNEGKSVDLLNGQLINIAQGQMASLGLKIPIDPSWLHNDQLAFVLEFVQPGLIDTTVVRCSQVSKKVTSYNRNYQCFVPGDTVPLLSYRLGNDQIGVSPALAQN